jgi:hypothetical protein
VQKFDAEALLFQERIIDRAGLGDETYLPVGALPASILLPLVPPAPCILTTRRCQPMVYACGLCECLLFASCCITDWRGLVVECGSRRASGCAAVRSRPPLITMENARLEAEMVMFGAVQDALHKCGLHPSQIGILVVNCSLFNPTPSLAA